MRARGTDRVVRQLSEPVFCLTTDLDWASDWAIEDLLRTVAECGIRPTVFATHATRAIDHIMSRAPQDVGIHPNFLPGSTQGDSEDDVLDHLFSLYPRAETFRSHCFYDHTRLLWEVQRRGIHYDSNLVLHLQPSLAPLMHGSGIVRFPVFWEDDVHWRQSDANWDVRRYLPAFLSPGLKILNIHPLTFATNVPGETFYRALGPHAIRLDAETGPARRFAGRGVRTFVCELLGELTGRGVEFHTLGEVYRSCPVADFLVPLAPATPKASE